MVLQQLCPILEVSDDIAGEVGPAVLFLALLSQLDELEVVEHCFNKVEFVDLELEEIVNRFSHESSVGVGGGQGNYFLAACSFMTSLIIRYTSASVTILKGFASSVTVVLPWTVTLVRFTSKTPTFSAGISKPTP